MLRILLRTIIITIGISQYAFAQDLTALGGDLTSSLPPGTALELPAPNIRSDEFAQFHLKGHADFHDSFDKVKLNNKLILGPAFNHFSCSGCHVKNGKGTTKFSQKGTGSQMLVKVSLRGLRADGSPKNVPKVGEQLQDHLVNGDVQYKIRLAWKTIRGQYPDKTSYELRTPLLRFDIPRVDETKIVTSMRMTPSVIGIGLLEAVPIETLFAMSDPYDFNKDGISGEVSVVPNLETGGTTVGRFGFRATHVNVKQQGAAAFFNDMGLTSSIFKKKNTQQEISDEALNRLTFYLQAAGVTPARDQDNPDVIAGKFLFQQIGCNACHVMTLRTGEFPVQELANQEFHPFTDLLLHDMGKGLSDKRPEFSAGGREWRTTPLWGLGLSPFLTKAKPRFLHDGRGRTIEEAILWHQGEAQSSNNKFQALQKYERDQLLLFLNSL